MLSRRSVSAEMCGVMVIFGSSQNGCGPGQGHRILQLVAKAGGAAGLVEAGQGEQFQSVGLGQHGGGDAPEQPVGQLEDAHHLSVELVNDGRWRAARRHDAEPGGDFVAGQRLGDFVCANSNIIASMNGDRAHNPAGQRGAKLRAVASQREPPALAVPTALKY